MRGRKLVWSSQITDYTKFTTNTTECKRSVWVLLPPGPSNPGARSHHSSLTATLAGLLLFYGGFFAIEKSFKIMCRDQFPGHRQEERWDKETNPKQKKRCLLICPDCQKRAPNALHCRSKYETKWLSIFCMMQLWLEEFLRHETLNGHGGSVRLLLGCKHNARLYIVSLNF